MIDVEHGPGVPVAVGLDPRGHGGVHLADMLIAALIGAAGVGDGRQRAELHMLRVGVLALDGFLSLHLHVVLLVLGVQKRDTAIAGIIGDQVHVVGLGTEDTPHHALLLIAGNGHPHTGGIALRQGLDSNIISHSIFLSQSFPRAVQQPQLPGHILRLRLQRRLLGGKTFVQPLAVVIEVQHPADVRQTEPHVLQRRDAAHGGQLGLTVIAVVGEPVDIRRVQQSDVVIMAQHPDADAGQLGKFSDLQHSGTSIRSSFELR